MYKLLKYFYYCLYKFALFNGERDTFVGVWIIGTFLGFNVFALLDFISLLFHIKIFDLNTLTTIAGGLIVYYITYLMLNRGDKPKKILEEFDKASKREKIWLNICLVLYIVLSIGLVIYTGNIIRSGSYLK